MEPQERDWFFSMTDERPDHTSAEILAAFVLTLADDLNTVTAHAPDLLRRLQFAEPFASATLPAAWTEVRETVPGLIREIEALSEASLALRGLTGLQLRMKVTAWDESRRSLVEILGEQRAGEMNVELRRDALLEGETLEGAPVFAPPLQVPVVPQSRPWPRRLLRRLAKTLDYADTILGSITPLVSLLEPLKEYKEIAEKVLGDAAEIQSQ